MAAALFLHGIAGTPVAADSANTPSGGRTLYRWTDAEGHVHYGDRIPPEAAAREHEQIDANGQVRHIVPAEKSAEELAAQERRDEEARTQAAHDGYLRSFASVHDLEAARDERLKSLDARLAQARKAIADNDATLTDLRGRTDAAHAEGPDAEAALQKQLQAFEASGQDDAAAAARLEHERADAADQYAHDIARYQQLNAAPGPAP